MNDKKIDRLRIKPLIVDVILTIGIYLFLTFISALLLNNGIIELGYLKVVNIVIVFISAMMAGVIKRVDKVVLSLLSVLIIGIVILIVSMLQKESGAESEFIILTTVVLLIGKLIPSVINIDCRKPRKRKSNKRK